MATPRAAAAAVAARPSTPRRRARARAGDGRHLDATADAVRAAGVAARRAAPRTGRAEDGEEDARGRRAVYVETYGCQMNVND